MKQKSNSINHIFTKGLTKMPSLIKLLSAPAGTTNPVAWASHYCLLALRAVVYLGIAVILIAAYFRGFEYLLALAAPLLIIVLTPIVKKRFAQLDDIYTSLAKQQDVITSANN